MQVMYNIFCTMYIQKTLAYVINDKITLTGFLSTGMRYPLYVSRTIIDAKAPCLDLVDKTIVDTLILDMSGNGKTLIQYATRAGEWGKHCSRENGERTSSPGGAARRRRGDGAATASHLSLARRGDTVCYGMLREQGDGKAVARRMGKRRGGDGDVQPQVDLFHVL
jgi:hypothetical protein